jgi:hypothetical protein
VKITPENIVKITLIAIVGTALVRMASGRLGIGGLSSLVN